MEKFKVVTLCGSTKFKKQFIEEQKRLTLEGNIVISVGLFGHSGDDEVWTEGTKEMLDKMHKAKIDMSDSIHILNVGGYIGSSTRSEAEYAMKTNKKITLFEGETIEYVCIEEFYLNKCDGDGAEVENENAFVEKGTVWQWSEFGGIISGPPIHLDSRGAWIEIYNEDIEKYFEIVNPKI